MTMWSKYAWHKNMWAAEMWVAELAPVAPPRPTPPRRPFFRLGHIITGEARAGFIPAMAHGIIASIRGEQCPASARGDIVSPNKHEV